MELGDCVGSNGERRKTLQLVWHIGSQVEGTCNRSSTSTQGSTSEDIHVQIHTWCDLWPPVFPRLGLGMESFINLYAHLLQVVLWMQPPWSYHTIIIPLRHPSVQDDIWAGSTLHVTGSDGGIDWHNRLVCLTPLYLHMDVHHREGSTCFTEVFHGQSRHARSVISHLDTVVS